MGIVFGILRKGCFSSFWRGCGWLSCGGRRGPKPSHLRRPRRTLRHLPGAHSYALIRSRIIFPPALLRFTSQDKELLLTEQWKLSVGESVFSTRSVFWFKIRINKTPDQPGLPSPSPCSCPAPSLLPASPCSLPAPCSPRLPAPSLLPPCCLPPSLSPPPPRFLPAPHCSLLSSSPLPTPSLLSAPPSLLCPYSLPAAPLLPTLLWANLSAQAREQPLWAQLEGPAVWGLSRFRSEWRAWEPGSDWPWHAAGPPGTAPPCPQPALFIQMQNVNNSFLGSTNTTVTGKHNIPLIRGQPWETKQCQESCIISKWLSLLLVTSVSKVRSEAMDYSLSVPALSRETQDHLLLKSVSLHSTWQTGVNTAIYFGASKCSRWSCTWGDSPAHGARASLKSKQVLQTYFYFRSQKHTYASRTQVLLD